jgi:hypothetical protein
MNNHSMPETTNQMLTDDHTELDAMLEEIFAALDAKDVRLSFSKMDLFWARLAMHIRAEHLHLFPAILDEAAKREKANENGEQSPSLKQARSAVEQLQKDHNFFMRELAAAVNQMRELGENADRRAEQTLSLVSQIINEVSRRLEVHNRLEEAEVYQWAGAIFDSSELASLNEKMQKELTNLPPRFGNL